LRQSEVPRQADAVLMGITVLTPLVLIAGQKLFQHPSLANAMRLFIV
jgi:hypothetical protein